MRNNYDQLPDESIGYDMSNLNESRDQVETLEQNNIPSSISPNIPEEDDIIHEVTEDYEVLNEPSANEEENYEINGQDYLIQQRNDNINFLINMEQNSINRNRKISEIAGLINQEHKYLQKNALNSKQRMPFIFCQEKMFKLVNNMRDNIQIKDSQRSIMSQNQQLNGKRGKSLNNLQSNRHQKSVVGVKNQLNNKKNTINQKQNIQNMQTRQSTEASNSVISDTIQGLESRTNFVCQNQCNTHGIQIKKYLNNWQTKNASLLYDWHKDVNKNIQFGRQKCKECDRYKCIHQAISSRPITAGAEDNFTSNKYSDRCKVKLYTQSTIRSQHNRAISTENTDLDPYSMNDPSTIYNDFSTQHLGYNNVLSKSLNNLKNNNYSTLNRKLSRPSTTNSYQLHSSRPRTSNNQIKQNARQQQNNWISPFERLKNPHYPYQENQNQRKRANTQKVNYTLGTSIYVPLEEVSKYLTQQEIQDIKLSAQIQDQQYLVHSPDRATNHNVNLEEQLDRRNLTLKKDSVLSQNVGRSPMNESSYMEAYSPYIQNRIEVLINNQNGSVNQSQMQNYQSEVKTNDQFQLDIKQQEYDLNVENLEHEEYEAQSQGIQTKNSRKFLNQRQYFQGSLRPLTAAKVNIVQIQAPYNSIYNKNHRKRFKKMIENQMNKQAESEKYYSKLNQNYSRILKKAVINL